MSIRDYATYLKRKIQYFFLKAFRLKFYAKQNHPPTNNGFDSFHLRKTDNAYFYGNSEEFEKIHRRV